MNSRRLFQTALHAVLLVAIALTIVVAPGIARPSTVGAAGQYAVGDAANVVTDRLNLRAAAGLNGAVLMVLPFGSALSILSGPKNADGYVWWQVGVSGIDSGTGGPIGWVAGEYIAGEGWKAGTTVTVVDGPLNLRADASTRQVRLASLPEGTNLTIVAGPFGGEGYAWYQVKLQNGDRGYVAGEFLGAATGSDNGGIHAGDGVRVSDGPVNFRVGPGLDREVLAVVPEGELFAASDNQVQADGYTWVYSFNYGRGWGWMATDFLSVDPNGFPGEEGA